ncbi:MAG: hypothetical protein QG602_1572 [Verrucomicrobiota bacterium]|nr:hypothetical protein [Verrucomicrobiota bacterium]
MKTSHLSRTLAAAVAGVFVALLTGCDSSKTYTVQVDAIANPTETGQPAASAQSYHIRSQNPKLDEDSLRYKEVADYVRTALSGKGMYEAPTPEKADVVIDIDYGMDAPRIKFETVSQPIYQQKEGDVYQTVVRVPIRNPETGQIFYVERVSTVRGPDKIEFMGTQETIHPVVVYEKFLKLSARENREATEGRAPPEVWSVNVSAEDNSQELRKYMPILASATADYIGTNTKESKPVKISEGDEVVTFIKKGM